ncbi:MAG TPA: hypothetical protein VGQ04_10715 [Chitinophagaceae bacterium]|jgi:hypothetical protein|nr:hypothetical protein [Chitinophagaceae bacterium]
MSKSLKEEGMQKSESPITTNSITEGYLDVLWTSSELFLDLPEGKLVFSFVFTHADKLTIHGWRDKIIGGFDPKTPVLKLDNGRASAYKYGLNIYFGNLILGNADINKIQRMIKKEETEKVFFVPEISETYYIKYKIHIGNEDPNTFGEIDAIDTGFELNPSPPR